MSKIDQKNKGPVWGGTVAPKNKGQAYFAPKRVKKVFFFEQKYISEPDFTFFEKNRVDLWKDIPEKNTIPGES